MINLPVLSNSFNSNAWYLIISRYCTVFTTYVMICHKLYIIFFFVGFSPQFPYIECFSLFHGEMPLSKFFMLKIDLQIVVDIFGFYRLFVSDFSLSATFWCVYKSSILCRFFWNVANIPWHQIHSLIWSNYPIIGHSYLLRCDHYSSILCRFYIKLVKYNITCSKTHTHWWWWQVTYIISYFVAAIQ